MLDPSQAAPSRWRNDAGSTRELASADDPGGQTRWRISVAELEHDADFSTFPGLDRIFVPLGPVRLVIDGVETAMGPGDQARFAGEAAAAVVLAEPTKALNVMTRRGRWSAEVGLRGLDDPAPAGVHTSVLLGTAIADIQLIPAPKDSA